MTGGRVVFGTLLSRCCASPTPTVFVLGKKKKTQPQGEDATEE